MCRPLAQVSFFGGRRVCHLRLICSSLFVCAQTQCNSMQFVATEIVSATERASLNIRHSSPTIALMPIRRANCAIASEIMTFSATPSPHNDTQTPSGTRAVTTGNSPGTLRGQKGKLPTWQYRRVACVDDRTMPSAADYPNTNY